MILAATLLLCSDGSCLEVSSNFSNPSLPTFNKFTQFLYSHTNKHFTDPSDIQICYKAENAIWYFNYLLIGTLYNTDTTSKIKQNRTSHFDYKQYSEYDS